MSHHRGAGREAVRPGLLLVLPAPMLNYFGQGAFRIGSPDAVENPFHRTVPSPLLYPTVGIAAMATAIASYPTRWIW